MRDADRLAPLVDALKNDPWMPRPTSVSEDEWAEARSLAEVESLLAVNGAPPLEQDPVAAMLGLRPVPTLVLDGLSIKRLRGRMSVSDVARRLQSYGWEVSSADVRSWQDSSAAVALAPALVERIAAVLGSTVDKITRQTGSLVDPAIADHPRWQSIVERLATVLKIDWEQAEIRLAGAMTTAAYRHEAPNSFLEAADAYVSGVEKVRET